MFLSRRFVMKIFLASILVICGLSKLEAQLSFHGKYRSQKVSLQKNSNPSTFIKEYKLPEQDNAQLLALAEAQESISPAAKHSHKETSYNVTDGPEEFTYTEKTPKSVPFKFGEALPLSINMNQSGDGEWIVNEESQTRMWRFKVSSKDAHAMSIYFSDFFLAPATELYIIGREDTLGAFTEDNNKNDRLFGIAPVAGDFLILEYIEPLNSSIKSSIVVSHSVHVFRPTPFSFKAADSAGSCNINVACPEGAGKADQINSVALLIDGKGESFCSGAMVNNVKRDGRQLFLTAEHCIGKKMVANYMFGFNYQYKYCRSIYEFKPQINTVHGARLLGKSNVTDYAILEIAEPIPDAWDVYMAGWDATGPTTRSGSFYGVHHPDGDPKKVSISTGSIELIKVTNIGKYANFWKVEWSRGVVEPGSSGSPLFDSNGLIIGHLLGGESSCRRPTLPDLYGGLMRDWIIADSPISELLDPLGTDTKQLDGASLKDLRAGGSSPAVPEPKRPETVQNTVTLTVTATSTIAKTTQVITSRVTVTVSGEKITYTRDVYKTITAPAELVTVTRDVTETITVPKTITQTFTRNPPPIIRTVTVKA